MILGGGILGTAVAALAALAGHRVVVFRLHDRGVPRADTLRNQGWLQSGVVFPISKFANDQAFKMAARTAYSAGRRLVDMCQLPLSEARAVLRVVQPERIAEIEHKARLLRYPVDEFRRLEADEAAKRLRGFYEADSAYFQLPDAPFDEARVLKYLRDVAYENGAQFIQLDKPATVRPRGSMIEIRWDNSVLLSPLTLVAAGAGSLPLLQQLRCKPAAALRQTPLLVQSGRCGVEVPLLVDLDRGYAAVLHRYAEGDEALVIGTNVKLEGAPFVDPELRRISKTDIQAFHKCLPANLAAAAAGGRFTAGYEVTPLPPIKTTFVEPFLQDFGSVVFASPGRATTALSAAELALAAVLRKSEEQGRRPFRYEGGECESWIGDVGMHFMSHYNFNDSGA